jgi:hypothetical protein
MTARRSGPVVSEHRSRATGTVVQVIDNRDGEFDQNAEENPWYTMCVDHGGITSHPTRALALYHSPVPDEWCPWCQMHLCVVCGLRVSADTEGTLVDETGGDVCAVNGDNRPHSLALEAAT